MRNQASVVAGRIPVVQHPLSQSLRKAIRFVSAPCSTGKTFAACRLAANWDLANHLYVAPTVTLLAETRGILKEQGVTCDIINSETHPNCVKTTIIEYLKTAQQTGHKLLVTQQAYLDLPFFPNRRNWEIIFDEVPQLDGLHPYELPVYRNLLLEHIELDPYRQTGLYHVTAKDRSKINNLLQRPYDDVLELLKPLLKKLVSPNHIVFADQDTRDKLMGARVQKRGTNAQNRIYFLFVLSPQAFENATILGANVEHSLLYNWCIQCGYQFKEHTEIASHLREAPSLGKQLDIRYFIPDRPFSKYLRDKPINCISLIDQMDQLAIEELRGQPFLYATNNDRAQPRPEWTNATPLSVASHGLNSYADHHAIYFSAALNREPKHYKLLEALGLSAEMIDQSTSHEIIYQAVMRTSLRNPDFTERVLAVVPDEPSAKTLAELTGCDRVSQLGNLVPSRPPKLTSVQKTNMAKAKKLLEKLYAPISVPDSIYNDSGIDSGKYPKAAHSSDVIVTFHKSPQAIAPADHTVKVIETQVWIGYLR